MTNMYAGAKTWNPFKGCEFDCSYCRPSFQAQAKRQKRNCRLCYDYRPHVHAERLDKIPTADIVFACGNGDVTFAPRTWRQAMLDTAAARPAQTFYFQSKDPACFGGLAVPANVILVTTLETDRDEWYRAEVSKTAPLPSERYAQFFHLEHPRKAVTIEPIMEFSRGFPYMLQALQPERVWVGYNSRPRQVQLTEPPLSKALWLIEVLRGAGIEVREKLLRDSRSNSPERSDHV